MKARIGLDPTGERDAEKIVNKMITRVTKAAAQYAFKTVSLPEER